MDLIHHMFSNTLQRYLAKERLFSSGSWTPTTSQDLARTLLLHREALRTILAHRGVSLASPHVIKSDISVFHAAKHLGGHRGTLTGLDHKSYRPGSYLIMVCPVPLLKRVPPVVVLGTHVSNGRKTSLTCIYFSEYRTLCA